MKLNKSTKLLYLKGYLISFLSEKLGVSSTSIYSRLKNGSLYGFIEALPYKEMNNTERLKAFLRSEGVPQNFVMSYFGMASSEIIKVKFFASKKNYNRIKKAWPKILKKYQENHVDKGKNSYEFRGGFGFNPILNYKTNYKYSSK